MGRQWERRWGTRTQKGGRYGTEQWGAGGSSHSCQSPCPSAKEDRVHRACWGAEEASAQREEEGPTEGRWWPPEGLQGVPWREFGGGDFRTEGDRGPLEGPLLLQAQEEASKGQKSSITRGASKGSRLHQTQIKPGSRGDRQEQGWSSQVTDEGQRRP